MGIGARYRSVLNGMISRWKAAYGSETIGRRHRRYAGRGDDHDDDDGTVTVRLHGFGTPITTSGEHLSLVAKKKAEPGRRKKLFDVPD